MDERGKRLIAELEVVAKSLDHPEDRTAIIVGCAYLDGLLDELLRFRLVPSKQKDDKLFGSSRPISSFSARIELAFRLGMIGEDVYDTLNLLRIIRNDFAHLITAQSLDTQSYNDRIAIANKRYSKLDGFQAYIDRFSKVGGESTTTCRAIIASTSLLLIGALMFEKRINYWKTIELI